MKYFGKYGMPLNEVTRWEIIRRSQREAPVRFQKKNNYRAKDFNNVDFKDLFENNNFTWSSRVGDYIVTISFEGPFDLLQWQLKSMRGKNRWKRINHKMLVDILTKALDTEDLFIDCTCDDFCLIGDTKIKLLNGNVITIAEMLDKYKNNEELWVYSTDDKGDFKPGKVTDVWISGYAKEFIKITLDNGEEIITTPNHKYMLRNGNYLEAESLQVGQSLMPLYFKNFKGYENVMLNSKPKAFVSVYKTVADEMLQKEIEEAKLRSNEADIAIHHSDYNKLNNYYDTVLTLGILENFNHKVKKIEKIILEEAVPVYDLTVDKYNNFYVDAGVVLHNCYRFAYWATQSNCKFGLPQNTAPKVRNVKNNKGYCCKHILAVLYGKRWVPAAAKAWLDFIRANPELSEWYIWGTKLKDEEEETSEENETEVEVSDSEE